MSDIHERIFQAHDRVNDIRYETNILRSEQRTIQRNAEGWVASVAALTMLPPSDFRDVQLAHATACANTHRQQASDADLKLKEVIDELSAAIRWHNKLIEERDGDADAARAWRDNATKKPTSSHRADFLGRKRIEVGGPSPQPITIVHMEVLGRDPTVRMALAQVYGDAVQDMLEYGEVVQVVGQGLAESFIRNPNWAVPHGTVLRVNDDLFVVLVRHVR